MAKSNCTIPNCARSHRALGYCNPHYLMFKRYGDPLYERPLINDGPCSVGCGKPSVKRGLCEAHARRLRNYGDPFGEPAPKPKVIRICSVSDCERHAKVHSMCLMHDARVQRTGTTEKYGKRGTCTVDQCLRPHRAHGYCHLHLQRWHKDGDPGTASSLRDGTPKMGAGGYVMMVVDGRRLAEHRYVMEQVIGRRLHRDENVHHVNGVRHDNRPENLELWTTMQPAGQRIDDQVAWATQILMRYAPHALMERPHAAI